MKSSMQGTGDVISKTFMMSLVKLIGKFCLFDLILYIPSTIFQLNRDGSSTKLG